MPPHVLRAREARSVRANQRGDVRPAGRRVERRVREPPDALPRRPGQRREIAHPEALTRRLACPRASRHRCDDRAVFRNLHSRQVTGRADHTPRRKMPDSPQIFIPGCHDCQSELCAIQEQPRLPLGDYRIIFRARLRPPYSRNPHPDSLIHREPSHPPEILAIIAEKGVTAVRATYTIDEIKSRLKPIFDDEPVYRAVLFGSYATGTATEDSDVDVVLDSRGELYSDGGTGGLLRAQGNTPVEPLLGAGCDVVIVTLLNDRSAWDEPGYPGAAFIEIERRRSVNRARVIPDVLYFHPDKIRQRECCQGV